MSEVSTTTTRHAGIPLGEGSALSEHSDRDSVVPRTAIAPVLVHDLAVEINEAHEAVGRAASSALDHAHQCGELLREKKAQLSHGEWQPWLAAHCPKLPDRTARVYMRVSEHWPTLEAERQRVADLLLREAMKLLTVPRQAHNSGDAEWYSPVLYVNAAREVMGGIDLDPASTAKANEVVKAKRFFTREEDGLQQPWHGHVFMNPPYANQVTTAFAERLIEHYRRGDVTEAVVLVNNATETAWFHALAIDATSVGFPLGRVRYWRADTRAQSSALQGQAIFYFGSHVSRFHEVFGELGLTFDGCRVPQRPARSSLAPAGFIDA